MLFPTWVTRDDKRIVINRTDLCYFSVNFMPPNDLLGNTERIVPTQRPSAVSKHFSTIRSLNRVLMPLKSASPGNAFGTISTWMCPLSRMREATLTYPRRIGQGLTPPKFTHPIDTYYMLSSYYLHTNSNAHPDNTDRTHAGQRFYWKNHHDMTILWFRQTRRQWLIIVLCLTTRSTCS